MKTYREQTACRAAIPSGQVRKTYIDHHSRLSSLNPRPISNRVLFMMNTETLINTVKEVLRKSLHLQHITSLGCFLSFFFFTKSFVSTSYWVSVAAAFFLGTAIMSSVHHAEVIAHKIGEGLGTIVLALSVTIIEVGLIVSLMKHAGDAGSVLARDTIFAAVMIITNGMVALCLILGGLKYKEQEFQVRGSQSFLVVLLTLSMLVFVLPNYTSTTLGPTYNSPQLIFIAVICILLYLLFVFFQTKSHKEYFEPSATKISESTEQHVIHDVSAIEAWLSFISLILSLVAVIALAKVISPAIESAITYVGAPQSVLGLIIAAIVLAPETWAAVNASRANRLQTSLNLALGSGIASIALTIPVVIGFSIVKGQTLVLGLDPKNLIFLVTTFLVASLTLGTGKSTLLQGAVHGVILITYFVMTLIP